MKLFLPGSSLTCIGKRAPHSCEEKLENRTPVLARIDVQDSNESKNRCAPFVGLPWLLWGISDTDWHCQRCTLLGAGGQWGSGLAQLWALIFRYKFLVFLLYAFSSLQCMQGALLLYLIVLKNKDLSSPPSTPSLGKPQGCSMLLMSWLWPRVTPVPTLSPATLGFTSAA